MTNENVRNLLEGLNADLAGELGAVIQYTIYSAVANGVERPQLVDFFQQEVADELGHARFLADKITTLGGIPTTKPDPVEIGDSNRDLLEAVLEAETRAIANYGQRLSQADEVGDIGLRVRLEDIISDETTHREETLKLLSGMRS
jgi:bacterioferritin